MLKLEELVPGAHVLGLEPEGAASIMAAQPCGEGAYSVVWRNSNGNIGSRLLYRENEAELSLQEKGLRWSFDGDGAKLRLVSEAWRIHYAHLFDPYLAVHTSDVEPLPHQISAVYQEMLGRLPLRYVLADDPGAGKTIMTGLFVKELVARGELTRCLIVCPGGLAEQWQDELYRKFNLEFEILNKERVESAVTGNIFAETGLAIGRMDQLARDENLSAKLETTEWDLIVCDEAHKMSATLYGDEVKTTKRFQLGRLLSYRCRHFLLLTATPHNGKEEDFQLFLSLIDEDRFGGVAKTGVGSINVSDVMRRLVKEELLKFDGSPLFPGRQAVTLNYDLSPEEAELYESVTAYVRSEFNRADQLANKRRVTVGFALTVLQRRLASSPEAIYQSLRRRRERLQKRLAEENTRGEYDDFGPLEELDEDDLPSAELEEMEEKIADRASAATNRTELEREIGTLLQLERMAGDLRGAGVDRKWEELSGLLQEEKRLFDGSGQREKLIIFTEHRDTLRYLADKIRSLLGNEEAVVTIYGGMGREARRGVEERFKQDKEVLVLVATDAAGEGLNLQRGHLMVNYDLPWNPNRLEQRFGRIHRIGQARTCWLWNLVASETREGAVFQRLFAKLEQEKATLRGKVFDILGKVSFNNRPLRELLIEAVRHKESEETISQAIDSALDHEKLRELIRERALTDDIMDAGLVETMRERMERMEARRLQPHFIETFFINAFKDLGGKIHPREQGRYEITYVPAILRSRDRRIGKREPVVERYQRVCFDKTYRSGTTTLLCPGHPLLNALLDVLREQGADLLKRGAILIDENDPEDQCRLLFYVESAIQDGMTAANGQRREISRRIHFVEMREDGFSVNAGYAPYLDYRAAKPEELAILQPYVQNQEWFKGDVEDKAMAYAATTLVPEHLNAVKTRKIALLAKTEKAVGWRLNAEIQHWDKRAAELAAQEKAGKRNASQNSSLAQRRAETLDARLKIRMAELAKERDISPLPPRLTGGCLVIPGGLLKKLAPTAKLPDYGADAATRAKIEKAAMAAVMAIERKLGYQPKDISGEKRGYDIESTIPESLRDKSGQCLRFLEVKGRAVGADSVNITRNEMLTGLNKPEQFILALVEVDGDKTKTTYLKKPFTSPPDFTANYQNCDIKKLLAGAELVYEE